MKDKIDRVDLLKREKKICPVRKDERPISCGPCSDCGSFPWIDG